ncbi:MAG: hypothetical protein AB8G95_21705 [Anaerolineae bacterium]
MGIESLLENGATFTQFLQANFPSLKLAMQAIHTLTQPEICFLLFIAIYWAINRDKGATYLYLFGLVLAIFSILSHLLEFPAHFWFDNRFFQIETRSFSAPNLNTAIALLLLYPFKRFIRTDLTLPTFLFVSLIAAVSQIYLGVASATDTFLGLLFGTTLILVWQAWNKRYGKRFSERILGQRFWAAIFFPALLGIFYLTLTNWAQTGQIEDASGFEQQLNWQAAHANALSALVILGGIGIGIAVESARVGFQPNKTSSSVITNWIIGFSVLAGTLYLFRTFFPIETLSQTRGVLSYISIALKYTTSSIVITYILPWIFTLIGTATAEAATVPEISLNNFSVSRQKSSI